MNNLKSLFFSFLTITTVASAEKWVHYEDLSQPQVSVCQEPVCTPCTLVPTCGSRKCGHVFGEVGYMHAKAQMDDLDYATFYDLDVVGDTTNLDAKVQNLNFHWNNGMKAVLGYRSDECSPSELVATGVVLHSEATGNILGSTDIGSEQVRPRWFPSLMGAFITEGAAKWNLNFKTLDLDFKKTFYVNSCLNLKPLIGVRTCRINQNYRLLYDGFYPVITGSGFEFLSNDNSLDLQSKFSGYGLKIGSDVQFNVTPNLSIDGCFAGSFVYGVVNVNEKVQGTLLNTNAGPAVLSPINGVYKDHARRLKYNFESQIGISYYQRFFRNCIGLKLSLDYFYSIWFNQNEYLNLTLNSNPQPLSGATLVTNFEVLERQTASLQLQGFILSLGLDY